MNEFTSEDYAILPLARALLYGIAPPKRVTALVLWLKARQWQCLGIDFSAVKRTDDIPNKREVAQQLFDAFRADKGIPVFTSQENSKHVLDKLATRLYCETFSALGQHDDSLSIQVSATVDQYIWKNDYLDQQQLTLDELSMVANTIFKNVIGVDSYFNERQAARLKDRASAKQLAKATNTKFYESDALETEIVKFLRSKENLVKSFTTSQIAKGIECEGQWREVGKVLGALARKDKCGVVFIVKHLDTGKDAMLWKWCPERKVIAAAPQKTDELVSKFILLYLASKEASPVTTRSLRAIREAMRQYFITMSNVVVDRCVKALLEDQKIISLPGFRGGKAYQIYRGEEDVK